MGLNLIDGSFYCSKMKFSYLGEKYAFQASTGTLTILDIKSSHEGLYSCFDVDKNDEKTKLATYVVKFLIRPSILKLDEENPEFILKSNGK
jgi:hypothetical protein